MSAFLVDLFSLHSMCVCVHACAHACVYMYVHLYVKEGM